MTLQSMRWGTEACFFKPLLDIAPLATAIENAFAKIDHWWETLRTLPPQLQAYRGDPDDHEAVHAVFRSIHSIKGNASFLGLSAIKLFAHSVENTLDGVRNEETNLTEELERLFVMAFNELDLMLNDALDGAVCKTLSDENEQLLAKIEDEANASSSCSSKVARLIKKISSIADEIAESKHEPS